MFGRRDDEKAGLNLEKVGLEKCAKSKEEEEMRGVGFNLAAKCRRGGTSTATWIKIVSLVNE